MSDALIRWSVRLALAAYGLRLAADLGCLGRSPVEPTCPWLKLTWAAGAVLLAAHTALAFHFVHQWDHAHAYAETARQSAALTGVNWGGGIYLNEFTLAVWLADATWLLISGDTYLRRPRFVGWALHAWLLFIAINGAIVFATGPIRWVTLIALTALAGMSLFRRRV